MFTTDFLNQIQAAYGLTSDYQLAKKLGVTTQAISNYRTKRSFLNDAMALKVAHLLDLEPLLVLACVNAERFEKQGDKTVFDFWHQLALDTLAGRVKMSHWAA